jgi:hypothetical protein
MLLFNICNFDVISRDFKSGKKTDTRSIRRVFH